MTVLDKYQKINRALADAYFTVERAGVPVYLDLDDEAFALAAASIELSREDLETELVSSSRSLLHIRRTGNGVLANYDRLLARWARDRARAEAAKEIYLTPPPVVALLAVFTIAAERMGDGDMSENAYYPQLFRLLDVPEDEQGRFKTAFRTTEWYWDALAQWLEKQDGNRGIPSAYALSHRFVGLPVSQALVRESERRRLTRMFEEMGLEVGAPVSNLDMEAALDQWIGQIPSPASVNLRSLWSREGARDRVADIALVEFRSWDGVARNGKRAESLEGGRAQRSVRLAVTESSDFFDTRFDFAALIPREGESPTQVSLVVGEDRIPLPARRVDDVRVGIPLSPTAVDVASALHGVLTFETTYRLVLRYPRRVVPFVKDTALTAYIESDTLALGVAAAILVADDGGLPGDVQRFLERAALPGFERIVGPECGVPAGWVLFTHVQAMQRVGDEVPKASPLAVLNPGVNVQMSLVGGFRIPGRITRWSRLQLPDVTVVGEMAESLTVRLESRDLETRESSTTILVEGPPPLSIPLRDFSLDDGDYVLLLEKGRTRLQSIQLRVRSSAEPDPYATRNYQFPAHLQGDALWPFRALPLAGSQPVVDGALSSGPLLRGHSSEQAAEASWASDTARPQFADLIVIAPPAIDSCVQTGAHRWRYPTFHGKYEGRFVFGTCTTCGMTRRDPSAHWDRLARKRDTLPSTPRRAVSELGSVDAGVEDWSAAVDSLLYLGGGSRSVLAGISRQIANSAIFENHFMRSMEALGIIEIVRDDRLAPVAFETATTSVAVLQDGALLLTGYWPQAMMATAEQVAADLDIECLCVNGDTAQTVYLAADPVEFAAAMLAEEFEIPVAPNAGPAMLARLPHLASVLAGLPTEPDPLLSGNHEVFIPASHGWAKATQIHEPGTMRQRSLGPTQYFFRTPEDVERATVRRVSMDVAKYLAAWQARVELFRYDPDTQELSVPLGAPLPGLFERAAVLCSGVLPHQRRKEWSLVYSEIPAEFVADLRARLT